MPTDTFELGKLDSTTFEQLANALAMRVLGAGHSGFGPGPDGGRDGIFKGKAPYPSTVQSWSGIWYLQSKFLKPGGTTNGQKWLLDQIKREIELFQDPTSDRKWPDVWIFVTNVDPSGKPQTGSYDKALELVRSANAKLAKRFAIWGGRKVLDLLAEHTDLAQSYMELITPGHVLAQLFSAVIDQAATSKDVIRHLIATQLDRQQFTKLDQAGSDADFRPNIASVFQDLPYRSDRVRGERFSALDISASSALRVGDTLDVYEGDEWEKWRQDPARSNVWFIRGGPGQGKSTLTQFIAQINRASLILSATPPIPIAAPLRAIARQLLKRAERDGFSVVAPRIPVYVELRDYARWFGDRPEDESVALISYLSTRLTSALAQSVSAGLLKKMFSTSRWLFIFDGLDEVPGDVKDGVAREVIEFINDLLVGCRSDAFSICTSRPQGYAGQFDDLGAAIADLTPLSPALALDCAKPVLQLGRSADEHASDLEILSEALRSPSVREIMTTPLQAHIMAVVVRGGNRPPERRWALFSNFYQVIKRREANRHLADRKLARLLREEDKLIKQLHNELGFRLHALSETSSGALTSLPSDQLKHVVREVVLSLQSEGVEETVDTLVEATTQRLVLVSTPDTSESVRFDIRPLQEFFAAEYLYESCSPNSLLERIRIIAADPHWREVMHFLISALVENSRFIELSQATVVLSEVNDGRDRGIPMPLAQALKVGGIITGRLLSEGVLEQDRNVRQQLRPAFETLLSSPAANQLMVPVKATQSRAWLQDVLFSWIKSARPERAVGAYGLLLKTVTDSDSKAELAMASFRDVPAPIFDQMLPRALDASMRARRLSAGPPKWFLSALLLRFSSPSWSTLGSTTVFTMWSALSVEVTDLKRALSIAKLPEEVAGTIRLIAQVLDFSLARSRRKRSVHFGVVELEYEVLPDALLPEKMPTKVIEKLIETGGLFQELGLIWRAYKNLKSGEGGEVPKLSPEVLAKLPDFVKPYYDTLNVSSTIPSNGQGGISDELQPGLSLKWVTIPNHHKPDWSGLLDSKHSYFVHLLNEASIEENKVELLTLLNDADKREKFVMALRRHPVSYQVLGALSALTEAGLIDSDFRAQCATNRTNEQEYNSFEQLRPFALDLRREPAILPILAASLVRPNVTRSARDEEVVGIPRYNVSALVKAFVMDPSKLIELGHTSPDLDVRAAAIALALSLPELQIDLVKEEPVIESLGRAIRSSWFIRLTMEALTTLIAESDPKALSLAGKLAEISESRVELGIAIEPVLSIWRQLEYAPVSKNWGKFQRFSV